MTAALKTDFLSVADYLEGEDLSETRHEYIGGIVYNMPGASRDHNRIALNCAKALDAHALGGPCQVSMSDLKLHVQWDQAECFYYPDVMVTCDPREKNRAFNQYPKVIIEVLSEGTERIDRIEKFDAYTRIETLEEYVLISQTTMQATVFRRSNHWRPEVLSSPADCLKLPSLKFTLPLPDIYLGVQFDP